MALGDEARGHVGRATSVTRDSRGRYFVATESRREEILVFHADGAFLDAIGRKGEGPGEHAWAGTVVITPGDTLHVFDVGLHRWTVFSSDLKVVGTRPIAGSYLWSQAVFGADQAVVNSYVGTRTGARFPMHLLDGNGRIVLSFGATDGSIVRRDLESTTRRKVARAGGGGVWSARVNEYRIELWDLTGRNVRTLVREPPWFESWVEARPLSPDYPPASEIRAIYEDREGRLWVIVHVADPEWKRSLKVWPTPEGRFYRPTDPDGVYDTYVEVIDPRAGAVLVSQRVPMILGGFVDEGLAFASRSADAVPRVQIWHLRAIIPETWRSK